MNVLKNLNYIIGLFFLLIAVISYYLVTKGTIDINVYSLVITISIAIAFLFIQFGKSIKTEYTINELYKVPHIQKMVEEAKTAEEKNQNFRRRENKIIRLHRN